LLPLRSIRRGTVWLYDGTSSAFGAYADNPAEAAGGVASGIDKDLCPAKSSDPVFGAFLETPMKHQDALKSPFSHFQA